MSAGTDVDASSSSKGYESLKIAGVNGTGAPTASKVSVEIIDMDEKEQLRRRREKELEGELRRSQFNILLLGRVDVEFSINNLGSRTLYLPGTLTALSPARLQHLVSNTMLWLGSLLPLGKRPFLELHLHLLHLCHR